MYIVDTFKYIRHIYILDTFKYINIIVAPEKKFHMSMNSAFI